MSCCSTMRRDIMRWDETGRDGMRREMQRAPHSSKASQENVLCRQGGYLVQETASNGAGFTISRAVFAFQRNEKETETLIMTADDPPDDWIVSLFV
ncbi:hypothetical protein EYF80_003353 [Liparis tanakae]|uniref:Uncharacterized protein n=1 Tax=Liparis tanakae TaxID=230148 RepID=A0A4Z2J9B2_9TELE|nr:hypothetical protein EYF80_003353 [Liparis tanakae]